MRSFSLRSIALSVLASAALASAAETAPLFQDDFSSASASASAWTVALGGFKVAGRKSDSSNPALTPTGATNLVVTAQSFQTSGDGVTFSFSADITWSADSRLVFLYRDPANYCYARIAGSGGVYRVLDGVETCLDADSGGRLKIAHGRAVVGNFKAFVRHLGDAIDIRLDRDGDFRDYDIRITMTDSAAVAAFSGATAFGIRTHSTNATFDDVAVVSGLAADTRAPATYHVDAATGDDSRTDAEAQDSATPWATLSRAALSLKSGDTALVHPGVYRERVVPTYAGGAGTPITYRAAAESGDPVVIDGSRYVGRDNGWEPVDLVNFAGKPVAAWRHAIDWVPPALFRGPERLFSSQEPDQADGDDPYDLAFFRPVPVDENDGTSQTVLRDSTFFTQPDPAYWVGATLLLYDGFANTITERAITAYNPADHSVTTASFGAYVGSNSNKADRYAIRNHIGVLDAPGEFYVEASGATTNLYVVPEESFDGLLILLGGRPAAGEGGTAGYLRSLAGAYYANAFSATSGSLGGYVLDGFEMRFQTGNAVNLSSGANDVLVANCDIHQTLGDGVSANSCSGIVVSNCLVRACYNNGVNFGYASDCTVEDCEITANGNNGIWAGTGGGTNYFNVTNFRVLRNYIHHQGGRRSHADNYQMHQCDNVLLDGNTLVQTGEQNGWCQYTGHLVFRNNILVGGPFGFNSVMFADILHNAFASGSTLRFDAHLTDHPRYGGDYRPQRVILRNNAVLETSISWPAATVVDRFAAFTVDHNYYAIANSNTQKTWDWQGYRCGLARTGAVLAANPTLPAAGHEIEAAVTTTWSSPGELRVLYRDERNYYAIGLSSATRGIRRVLNGVSTELYADKASPLLLLPHASPSRGTYTIAVTNDASAVRIVVTRGDRTVEIADTDRAAVSVFTGAARFCVADVGTSGTGSWTYIDSVRFTSGANAWFDAFADGDYAAAGAAADGVQGFAWTLVGGTATVAGAGGNGVGYGAGSFVEKTLEAAADEFVLPPVGQTTEFDFHLLPTSRLRGAGLPMGVLFSHDGSPRSGEAPSIGPEE